MSFFNEHPGVIYVTLTLVTLCSNIIMAAALVSIARSLRNKKKDK